MVGERATDGAYTWALKTHASVSLRRFLAYLRHGSVNELSWVYSLVRAAWSLFRATRWLGRAPLPLCQQEEEGGGRGPWKQLISRNAVSARCEQLHRNVFNVSNHRSNYRTDAFTFPTLPCLGMNIIIQLSSLARLINCFNDVSFKDEISLPFSKEWKKGSCSFASFVFSPFGEGREKISIAPGRRKITGH